MSKENKIDRRGFIKASGTMAAGSALGAGCAGKVRTTCPAPPPVFKTGEKRPALSDLTNGRPPNILLMMTDQERWPGNLPSTLRRPHMDRLLSHAVRFDNTFCAYPLCSPSRSAMFSGLYPHQSGVTQNMIFPVGEEPLDPSVPHIGSVLASAGYKIGYKGKWDMSKGPTYYLVNLSDRGRAGDYGYEGHCGDVPDQEYAHAADDQVVNMACDWIKKQDRNNPWFLTCSIINPHDICHPQLKPDQTIRPDVTLPDSLHDDLKTKPADQLKLRESKLAHFSTTLNPNAKPFYKYEERDWKLFLSFYYDLIEQTDAYIGRLFRALEDTGMLDNTIIVYTSDHGELGGAHGFSGKYMGYEEDLHVPLYFYHPALLADQVDTMVSNVSIGPTISSLAGVEWPAKVPGRDLSAWLRGEDGPREDAIFSESETHVNALVYKKVDAMRMIRTRKWKYSYSFYDVRDGQLYDLEADPIEMNNLFHDPAHKGIRKELEQRLRAWQSETGDTLRFEHGKRG